MKKIISLLVGISLLGLCATPLESKSLEIESPETKKDRYIYLVRHAEKEVGVGKNPELTKRGKERAKNLALMFAQKNITEIYSTNYKRTMQTAYPLAAKLDYEIRTYDPRALKEFAETIKAGSGNIVIVGHSNTTPMLAYLLGGEAQGAIDESEYDRVYQLAYHQNAITTKILRSSPVQERLPKSAFQFKPENIHNFRSKFQMLFNGDKVGHSTHLVQKKADHILIQEKTVIEEMKIDADIQVTADLNTLAPLKMTMTGTMGDSVDIKLRWKGDTIEGHSRIARSPYQTQGQINLKTDYSPRTLERSTAIILAHLSDVDPERPFAFEWFDAYSVEKKLITVSHQGSEKIVVPAGTFETDKIRFEGGAPSQLFYVSRETIPRVIRIDIISMSWQYELIE